MGHIVLPSLLNEDLHPLDKKRFNDMGPDKAWGAQYDLGARYRPLYPLENFLFEALLASHSLLNNIDT